MTIERFEDVQHKTTKKHIHIKLPPRGDDHSEVMDKFMEAAWTSEGATTPKDALDKLLHDIEDEPHQNRRDQHGEECALKEEDAMDAWAAGDAMTPQEALFHQVEHRHHSQKKVIQGKELATARRRLKGRRLQRRRVGRETLRKEHEIADYT
jgi:hypothetical protein